MRIVTTIKEQASDEQKAYWTPKIMDWSIIGCYAQSELGHGSNVRGLETTATWDPKTKKFEIHSPTLTASKVDQLNHRLQYLRLTYSSGGTARWAVQQHTP